MIIFMESLLTRTWTKTIRQFKNNTLKLSSEKSLVFWYAWNLKSDYPDLVTHIDFERNIYQGFKCGTFIDLYLEIALGGQKHKIGIEFKYPHN